MEEGHLNSYIKAIHLLEYNGEEATTLNIARQLGIRPASVTEMLKKLAAGKYVSYSPYKGAKLARKGKAAAKKIIRKHLLLEILLKKILKLSDKEVCGQASALESALSDHADQQLCVFLGRPTKGTVDHGDILHCAKKISCRKCLAK